MSFFSRLVAYRECFQAEPSLLRSDPSRQSTKQPALFPGRPLANMEPQGELHWRGSLCKAAGRILNLLPKEHGPRRSGTQGTRDQKTVKNHGAEERAAGSRARVCRASPRRVEVAQSGAQKLGRRLSRCTTRRLKDQPSGRKRGGQKNSEPRN